MNESRLIALLAALAVALPGACTQQQAHDKPPLEGARIGGPFTLIDQNGKQVSDRDFDGRYRLIYFGYTYCPDVCPTTLQKLMQGLKEFAAKAPHRAAKVQPIFITIDPARDTPPVLKQYVAAFDPRLIGLTGSEDQIAAAAKEYAVSYGRAGDAGASNYLMQHTSLPLLFGPHGEPIAVLPAEEDAKTIAAEIDKWVR